MEPHSTTAIWEGSTLTLYESSQGVVNLRGVLAQMFGLPVENVRVITKFVGSGFGSKLWPWTLCPLAAAAARQVNAPVRLVLARKMMFHAVGHRPRTQQRVRLGATKEGKLLSLQQDYIYTRSMLDAHHEGCGEGTPFAYSVPNLRVTFGRTRRNIGSGADMRGPGRVPGLYAIESAMNELAHELKMDPVQLRILNEPKIDEGQGLPIFVPAHARVFASGCRKIRLVEAQSRDRLDEARRLNSWLGSGRLLVDRSSLSRRSLHSASRRRLMPRGKRDARHRHRHLHEPRTARLGENGRSAGQSGSELGDTAFPEGPISGGSMATPSLVNAVFAAADQAIESLKTIAVSTPGSPFVGHKPEELSFDNGALFLKADGSANSVRFDDLLRRANLRMVTGNGQSPATFGNPEPKFSTQSFGCHFVEVTWQPEIARLRVSRVVSVIDAGKIINTLAGRNQIQGAVVMGIGMALLEATEYDPQNGAPINSSLADYLVAVNADAPSIDVHFLDYPDKEINEIGARGIGEIGLAGIAAAITDAVHHATGVRVRELPVRIEDLLA